MPRVRVKRIAIALGVGAVVNILVAWRGHWLGIDPQRWRVVQNQPWPLVVPPDWPSDPTMVQHAPSRLLDWTIYSVSFGNYVDGLPETGVSAAFYLRMESSGWPYRSMARYEAASRRPQQISDVDVGLWKSGVGLSNWMSNAYRHNEKRLPILPLWPGFLANTLFYASVPWLLMFGVATLIRRRRIRRGLCIQCAYPISGLSVCPECGTTGASVGSNSGQVVHVVTEP